MKRLLILIALLMSSVAWAGSTTVVVGQKIGITYSSDLCTGGTASADTEESPNAASRAFDNQAPAETCDSSMKWQSTNTSMPHWVQYDFGSGVSHAVIKVRLITSDCAGLGLWLKDFIISGSNNGSSWDQLYSGTHPNDTSWHDYYFTNTTAYRYIRITVSNAYSASYPNYAVIQECEMMKAQ